MRSWWLVLGLCLTVFSSSATAHADGEVSDPRGRTCGIDGLWTAHAANFTTRIANGRWRTWSGVGIDESTPPSVEGWLEITSERLTFDFDSGQTGYAYAYTFEDGCDVLHIRLEGNGTEYVFTRGPG